MVMLCVVIKLWLDFNYPPLKMQKKKFHVINEMCLNSKLKFGGHKRCDSEDVIIWLKSHVTVWAGAYQGNIPSGQVWWP